MDDLYRPYGSDRLSLAERAQLRRLPDELSIYEISLLLAPDKPSEQLTWQNILVTLAQEGKLAVSHGDPNGWRFEELSEGRNTNRYPRCEEHLGWTKALRVAEVSKSPLSRSATIPGFRPPTQVGGQAALIHRDALKPCLDAEEIAIPKDSLLDHRWLKPSAPSRKPTVQQLREQVLKEWWEEGVRSRRIDPDLPLDMTQKEVWEALRKRNPDLFPFRSSSAIRTSWKNQHLCTLRPGRREMG